MKNRRKIDPKLIQTWAKELPRAPIKRQAREKRVKRGATQNSGIPRDLPRDPKLIKIHIEKIVKKHYPPKTTLFDDFGDFRDSPRAFRTENH